MNKLLTLVYRSPRHDGMYLYVAMSEQLSRVPATLLEHFGTPQEAMRMLLYAERKLANADVDEVIQAIAERGFYLQMAAGEEHAEMAAVAARNDKLQRTN